MSDAGPVWNKSHARRLTEGCAVNATPVGDPAGSDAGVPVGDPVLSGSDAVPVWRKSSSRKQREDHAWSNKPVGHGIMVDASPVRKKACTRQAREPLKAPWRITKCRAPLPKIQVQRQESRGQMRPQGLAVNHPAFHTLQQYATKGCPAKTEEYISDQLSNFTDGMSKAMSRTFKFVNIAAAGQLEDVTENLVNAAAA